MIGRYRSILAEVRATYTPEKRREEARRHLPGFLLYRPLSFWLTPLALALGLSANAVSLLGLAVGLAMLPAALWAGAAAPWLVVGLALANRVLDCVDGNVARLRGSTPAGGLIDDVANLTFWTAYFVALGLLAEGAAATPLGAAGAEIGLAVALLFLFQRHLENDVDAAFGDRLRIGPQLLAQGDASRGLEWLAPLLEELWAFGGILVAAWLGRLDAFCAVVALYQVGLFLAWLPGFVRRLRAA